MLEWITVAVISTLAMTGLCLTEALRRADEAVYDQLQRLVRRTPDSDIVIVAIDDRSLAELGGWPWPRTVHASLIDQLAKARPKAIVYDLLFLDPDSDPQADAALGAAIHGAGGVYLPSYLEPLGRGGHVPHLVQPVPTIAGAAAGLGLVNVQSDDDGLVRRMVPFESVDGRAVPNLMTVVRRATSGGPDPPPRQPMMIPFVGPAGAYRTIAFSSVLRGEAPVAAFRDRVVLVGVTATGLGERFPTPSTSGASRMSGVELQANILDALRAGRMIHPAGRALRLIFSLTPLWLLLAAFVVFKPRLNLVIGAGLAIVVLGVCAASALLWRIWLPPSVAVLGLAVIFPLWGWRRLAGVSDYLSAELRRLSAGRSRSAGSPPPQPARGDPIVRQALSLGAAIERLEELRRVAADTLFRLPDATLVTDSRGGVVAVSRAAQALFAGLGYASVQGMSIGWLLTELAPLDRAFGDNWPSDQPDPPTIDLRLGDGRAFELQTVPRTDDQDRTVGWIVRLVDVTALQAALRQREQALQLLTHDIRSPQTSILALLDNQTGEDIAPEAAYRIRTCALRTLALADGFVQLSRAEAATPLEPLNLCDVVVDAVDELWPQSRQRQIEILQTGGDEPRYVLGDRAILTRAFVNIIGNALKYGPPGSRIHVSVERLRREGQDLIAVSVKDQGPGLSPAEIAAVFEPFRRFERREAAAADGVGLGLAIVQAAAAGHHGAVTCRSAPGEGATFTLELPEVAPPVG